MALIGAIGVFSFIALISILFCLSVSVIAFAFWIKSQGFDSVPLMRFIYGSLTFGFVQGWVLSWVGTHHELLLGGAEGWLVFFVALAISYPAQQILNPTFLGL